MPYSAPPPELPPNPPVPQVATREADAADVPTISARPEEALSAAPEQPNGPMVPRLSEMRGGTTPAATAADLLPKPQPEVSRPGHFVSEGRRLTPPTPAASASVRPETASTAAFSSAEMDAPPSLASRSSEPSVPEPETAGESETAENARARSSQDNPDANQSVSEINGSELTLESDADESAIGQGDSADPAPTTDHLLSPDDNPTDLSPESHSDTFMGNSAHLPQPPASLSSPAKGTFDDLPNSAWALPPPLSHPSIQSPPVSVPLNQTTTEQIQTNPEVSPVAQAAESQGENNVAPPNLERQANPDSLSFQTNEESPDPDLSRPTSDDFRSETVDQNPNSSSCEQGASEQAVLVNQIQARTENPVFSEAELDQIFARFEGRELDCTEQQEAANALTQAYLNRGYLTTRVEVAPESALDDGILNLQVQEGFIEDIEILGLERLRENYIRRRIERATSPPVSASQLEDQLRLLRQSPLIENIEASLVSGKKPGGSILRVQVVEANPFDTYIGLDNYSPPTVGSTQGTLALAHLNLTGRGDRLGASYQRTTTGGASTLDINYALPVNAMDGTVSVGGTFEWTRIPLSPTVDIDGNSQEYSINFRQPLKRTTREEFALSIGFDYRNGQTFLGNQPFGFGFGPDPDTGISRTSVIRFGQDYVKRDLQGAWSARSQFNLGTGLFGATSNPSPIPDSHFISWIGQAQRVQQLNPDNLLIISADVQLTPDALLPSEKFVIGGGQSVRGYRQNLRGGDNGFRLSVEDRITLQRDAAGVSTLQLAPFVDMGATWNVANNPNPQPPQRFLMGLGMGVLWEPLPDLNVRLDYGIPLISTPRGNDLQDHGIYFQIGYRI